MSPAKSACAAVLVLGLCLSSTAYLQTRIDASRPINLEEELLYLPNEKLLNHFTGGMSSVIADLLWLRCIQYVSKEFRSDFKFTWLDHMCRTITRLDPHFVDVYRYGGIFLASLQGDDTTSLGLLDKGIENNPHAWELMWEAAMVWLVNRRGEPESSAKTAKYLSRAVETGHAHPKVLATLEGLQRKHDLFDIERRLWTNYTESEDQLMRDLGERKLKELDIRVNCRTMDQGIATYKERFGRPPEGLDDLVSAGILRAIPPDPFGGKYFIDAEGEAHNTSLLNIDREQRLTLIRGAIGRFFEQQGRYPNSLDELAENRYLRRVPRHPYADQHWRYDPGTGHVE